jgi:hypothetical protein
MSAPARPDSWLSLTRSVLFGPTLFFSNLPPAVGYQTTALYLGKTALVISLVHAIVISAVFYCVVTSFASILAAFIAIFGVLLTPVIAVAGNIPPEQVPAAIAEFSKGGGTQILALTAKLGLFIFLSLFMLTFIGTAALGSIAYAGARALGGKGSAADTASACAYGSAAWLLTLVPVVNAFAPIYTATLGFVGIKSVHKLSTIKALAVVAFAALVPTIAIVIYCTLTSH